jgi:hypothetical protein
MKSPTLFALLGMLFAFASAADKRSFAPVLKPNSGLSSNGQIVKRGNETVKNFGWAEYMQCDSRWGGIQLGTCDDGTTICNAGCAMTSVAMILQTKGAGQDPASLNDWLTNNGGYMDGCGIYWGTVDAFGVTSFQGIETADEDAICNGLNNGHGIVANVNNGGHWVLLTACAGNGVFYANDPGWGTPTYTMGEILMEAVYH